ncbi:MAG: AAA family ATPase [Pseudomonadota bacterium]
MNDQSPRRYRGSLLERAAALYPIAPPPIVEEEEGARASRPAPAAEPPRAAPDSPGFPMAAPVAAPMPAPTPVDAPVPVAEPSIVPESAPVGETPEPVLRRGFDADEASPPAEPTIEPAPQPDGRRRVTIDRDRLAEMGALQPGAPVTTLAEEFRMVKRQLLLTARAVAGADAERARMVLVCSANANEGKTFCAINLALSMAAEKDYEILLVDADFAKPDVLGRLGVSEGPGLLDALAGAVTDVEDCILATDVPHLSILPAGARSSSDTELLASDRAHRILDGLAAADPRRIVIFDSPPALAASPASVLALHAGQVMLVVRADKTSESDLREAVAVLDGCEHIQLVLNAVSYQPGGRRFGSYYYEEAGK